MTRFFVFPYQQNSQGAKSIAEALNAQRLLRKNSRYKAQEGDVIINWGASDIRDWLAGDNHGCETVLNMDTKAVTNKREFFRRTLGSPFVPRSEENRQRAVEHLRFPIVCRTKLEGKDGEGIVIANNADEMVDAPLYVEYEKKTAEYRVHLGRKPDGTSIIIGIQQKLRPHGIGVDNGFQVRNHGNGFRFFWTKEGKPVEDLVPMVVKNAAFEVFNYFPELTFGAFDVIYHGPSLSAYVLEINTAPGQAEKTSEKYAEYFKTWAEQPVEEPAVKVAADNLILEVKAAVDIENKDEIVAELQRAFYFWGIYSANEE